MNFTLPKIRSVRDQVYDGIKDMVIKGQIPQGTKLQESELAELFQVSRTPVREALKLLVAEGLLENNGKGICVKVLTPSYLRDIFEMRSVLEVYAIRRSTINLNLEQEQQLIEMQKKFQGFLAHYNEEEYNRIDALLHDCIIDFTGSQCLREVVERIFSILEPVRLYSINSRGRYRESVLEHIDITDRMLAHDADGAAASLKTHLDKTLVHIIPQLQQEADKAETKPT